MNERIDQLIQQCTTQQFSDCVGGYETFDKEKFAELIVEECIKLNGKELAMAGHSRMVDVYCEHFGIEL